MNQLGGRNKLTRPPAKIQDRTTVQVSACCDGPQPDWRSTTTISMSCSKCQDSPKLLGCQGVMCTPTPPLPRGLACRRPPAAEQMKLILLLGLVLGLQSTSSAPSAWKTSAVTQLKGLEEGLLQKETSLLERRREVQHMREAEERAARRFIRRAAFDVGSGATKILIADVDMHAAPVPRISKVIFQKKVSILMSEDLHKGEGTAFSSGILHELMETLKDFKEMAEAEGAEQFAGAATAAFRKATNGPEFLKQVHAEGINLKIISQELEASIGFLTASQACPDIASTDLIAWDSGGGSFQVTSVDASDLCLWLRSVGSGIATSVLIEQVQGKVFKDCPSPNPVTIPQAQSLVRELRKAIGEPPEWLAAKARAPGVSVVGIGSDSSIFCLASQLAAKDAFSKADVLEGIENLCGKTDLQLRLMEDTHAAQQQPHNVIPKLVLLYTVMDILGVEKVLNKQTNGNVPGIVVTPDFWP